MLPLFTTLLKDFLVREGVVARDRVALGPPDQAFVSGASPVGVSLNIYLADIRENRQLRSNERSREYLPDGTVRENPYPAWIAAHYLISAWSKGQDRSAATLAEQRVLAAVSAALLSGDPFTPNAVYRDPTDDEVEAALGQAGAAGGALGGAAGIAAARLATRERLARAARTQLELWPEEFRTPGLDYRVLPPDGFPKISEFWTTMGPGSTWKPAVYLVASVPVKLPDAEPGPIVRGISSNVGQADDATAERLTAGTAHPWHQIGGRVLSFPEPQVPISGARVTLQVPGVPPRAAQPVQEVRSDGDGRFRLLFAGVGVPRADDSRADANGGFHTRYELVVRDGDRPPVVKAVNVTAQHPNEYDVFLPATPE